MRTAIALSAVAVAFAAHTHERSYYETRFVDHVNEFKLSFKDGAEFVRRMDIFASNLDYIESENAMDLSYKLGVNKFTHLTFDEFKAEVGLNGSPMPESIRGSEKHVARSVASLPASVDWVSSGAVTPVKNQGSCGSCWSFSTTGAIEGAYAVKTGSLQSYSEQQLVDCAYGYGENAGCNGGLMDDAFAYLQANGGSCTEASYPYTMGSWASTQPDHKTCQTTCQKVAGTAPTKYTDVATTDNDLMSALAQQPVSVAIQANQKAFQSYKSGVLTGRCGTRLDHGVLAVGYGAWTDGTPYYKVKNSWGTTWGMDGYILIEREVSQEGGECGILLMASYPTL